jgi:N-acetylglucosaminyldiphosphoundecaprenol N-acetyl-beta-D-mannosaminyltransferase
VTRGWRHYFHGGKPGVPEQLAAELTRRFPGLVVAGTCSPPFRPLTDGEDDASVAAIRAAAPDIVWVGLGLPKQERWIARHLDRVGCPWMVGVGAAFDFHAGTVKRAPEAWQRAGLEWLYRLAFEPRMLIRNLRSLSVTLKALGHMATERPRRLVAR